MSFQTIAFVTGVICLSGVAGMICDQNHRLKILRHEETVLEQKMPGAIRSDEESTPFSSTTDQKERASNLSPAERSRLLELRGEVTVLRYSIRELGPLRDELESLRQQINAK